MATSGLQKAIIPLKNVSALSILPDGTPGHYVRYRIVSEDRNRFSHWSPVYAVRSSAIEPVNGSVSLTENSTIVNVVWGDKLHKTAYDIFVNWDYEIESIVRYNASVTLTTVNDHEYVVGDTIKVLDVDNFDGSFTVTAITARTITYHDARANETGTIVPGSEVEYSQAFYHGTPRVHSYQFLNQVGAKTVYVYVQVEGVAKEPTDVLEIFAQTIVI
jgi:hypothetical protein